MQFNLKSDFFVGDTTLYMFVDNTVPAAQALNNDLSNICEWAKQWLVKFSPPKTVSLNISKRKKKLVKPDLVMGGVIIKEVDSHKHLGCNHN